MRALKFHLGCEDAGEFERRFSKKVAADGIFIVSSSPPPLGEPVKLRIELKAQNQYVAGQAVVVEHRRAGDKLGFVAKLVKLDADGIQFALPEAAPVPVAAPKRIPTPPPAKEEQPEPATRLYQYSESELVDAVAQEEWAGGLKPFDGFGNYQLLMRLGGGGMAEVYLARAQLGRGIDKLVALKVMRPDFGSNSVFASLFLEEARISITLAHPNLVQVFDFGEAMARPYLAMEYVEGWNVAALVRAFRKRGWLPPAGFAVSVAIELCRALEYVHEPRESDGRQVSLVHRDVSGSNVLVSDRGHVKLVDFGVATSADEAGGAHTRVGKPGYMSPEQCRGESPKPAWDIYALGVLLDQMLTLRPPQAGPAPADAPLEDLLGRPPPSSVNTEIPHELDDIVRAATEPDPARRTASAAELRAQLESLHCALTPAEIGAMGRELLGGELVERRNRAESLVAEGRKRSPGRDWKDSMLLRPVRSLGRRIVGTRAWIQLSRHPSALRAAVAALVLVVAGGAWAGGRWAVREHEFREQLALADEQIGSARLVGPGAALELLVSARELRPGDARAESRLRSLADALERLGAVAETRGHPAEAAVHFEAALKADPSRKALADRIRILEQRLTRHSVPSDRSQP